MGEFTDSGGGVVRDICRELDVGRRGSPVATGVAGGWQAGLQRSCRSASWGRRWRRRPGGLLEGASGALRQGMETALGGGDRDGGGVTVGRRWW